MPRPPIIPAADLTNLIADGGATWRHTSLVAALVAISGCSERTARRTLSQACKLGLIENIDGVYLVAQRPAASDHPAPPKTRPITGSHVTNSTGRRHQVDRRRFLDLLHDPMTYTQLIAATCERFGCSQTTARYNLALAQRYGYIRKTSGRYHLTDTAHRGLDSYGRLTGRDGLRFARFCSGRPGVFQPAPPARTPPRSQ